MRESNNSLYFDEFVIYYQYCMGRWVV